MEKYPLAPLLAVREYREEAARNAVRTAEAAVREAEEAVRARQEEWQAYQHWRVEEEDRRYDAIMGRELTLKQIDEFKAGLASLRDTEQKKEEAVMEAMQAVEKCRAAVAAAQAAVKEAQKETSKILAHKDIWLEQAKKEAERQEDLEMEEFKPLPPQGAENPDE